MHDYARVVSHLCVAAALAGRSGRQPEVREAIIEGLFHLRRQHWCDVGMADLADSWWPD